MSVETYFSLSLYSPFSFSILSHLVPMVSTYSKQESQQIRIQSTYERVCEEYFDIEDPDIDVVSIIDENNYQYVSARYWGRTVHAVDQPAIEVFVGCTNCLKKLHPRLDLPEKRGYGENNCCSSYHQTSSIWCCRGRKHRVGGSARRITLNNYAPKESWYMNNKLCGTPAERRGENGKDIDIHYLQGNPSISPYFGGLPVALWSVDLDGVDDII